MSENLTSAERARRRLEEEKVVSEADFRQIEDEIFEKGSSSLTVDEKKAKLAKKELEEQGYEVDTSGPNRDATKLLIITLPQLDKYGRRIEDKNSGVGIWWRR